MDYVALEVHLALLLLTYYVIGIFCLNSHLDNYFFILDFKIAIFKMGFSVIILVKAGVILFTKCKKKSNGSESKFCL